MDLVNFFREEEPRRAVINGPRPSPLRINKDSHVIKKPSSTNNKAALTHQNNNARLSTQKSRVQPVIIYTHSPKIIHTKPKDFMALVQKLTGFSRSGDQIVNGAECKRDEDNDHSSSVTSDEKYDQGDNANDKDYIIKEGSSYAVSPVNKGLNLNPYLNDFPLFTPNSNNFFPSPQPAGFRCPDLVFTSPNILGSLSPSFVEFMKGLPDY